MNLISKLLFVTLIISVSQCTKTTEPTSPADNSLTLNKFFDSVTVNIKSGESISINQLVTIKFNRVVSDSRCPMDAICVWAGNGEVELTLINDRKIETKILNTMLEPRYVIFGDYIFELKGLNPYPRSDQQIDPADYNIDLIIKPMNNSDDEIKSVRLINGSDTSIIEKDLLNVNGVEIDSDLLAFNISYSGGCREHKIELYGLKEIAESNPAQVTLMLSHNADNDMCEAYLTQKILFDLTALKNYLRDDHNINDKVLLIIHDTSGKPINNPVVEYTF